MAKVEYPKFVFKGAQMQLVQDKAQHDPLKEDGWVENKADAEAKAKADAEANSGGGGANLEEMTKAQLIVYAKETYGVDLDGGENKGPLLVKVKALAST